MSFISHSKLQCDINPIVFLIRSSGGETGGGATSPVLAQAVQVNRAGS